MPTPKVKIPLNHFNTVNFRLKSMRGYILHHLPKEYQRVYGGDPLQEPSLVAIKTTFYKRASWLDKDKIGYHSNNLVDMNLMMKLIMETLKDVAYTSIRQVAEIKVSKKYSEKQSIEIEVIEL